MTAKTIARVMSPGMHGPEFGNVHEVERDVSLVAGLGLLAFAVHRLVHRRFGSGALLGLLGGDLILRGVTGHCYAYSLLGINTARPNNVGRARSDEVSSIPLRQGVNLEASIVVDRPVPQVYSFWRELENLPKFMRHLESVENIGLTRSRWVANAVLGAHVTWEAELVNVRRDEVIAWRSVPGSELANAGSVRFERVGDGSRTLVKVRMKYNPPAGKLADVVAKLFGDAPQDVIQADLQRFKALFEAIPIPDASQEPRRSLPQELVELLRERIGLEPTRRT